MASTAVFLGEEINHKYYCTILNCVKWARVSVRSFRSSNLGTLFWRNKEKIDFLKYNGKNDITESAVRAFAGRGIYSLVMLCSFDLDDPVELFLSLT